MLWSETEHIYYEIDFKDNTVVKFKTDRINILDGKYKGKSIFWFFYVCKNQIAHEKFQYDYKNNKLIYNPIRIVKREIIK